MRPTALARRFRPGTTAPLFLLLILASAADVRAAEDGPQAKGDRSADGWVVLVGPEGVRGWKSFPVGWQEVGAAYPNAGNLKSLAATSGQGVIYNGRLGRAPNLVSADEFGDVEAHVEFMVPRGSNSGVKFEGVYEIQIFDSYGVKTPTASDNGGVYPRAELLPKYHHIDDGYPPRVNGSRPPGEWQTLDVVFRAPKFDADGKKVADARFDTIVLNGQVVHEGLSLPCPTGHAWRRKEEPKGPFLLQGDHGPVAFRNVRLRPLKSDGAD